MIRVQELEAKVHTSIQTIDFISGAMSMLTSNIRISFNWSIDCVACLPRPARTLRDIGALGTKACVAYADGRDGDPDAYFACVDL